jgi:hypothetical protein
MSFDTSRFFEAFGRAGFLESVQIQTGINAGTTINADYREPAQVLWDGIVQSTDYSIEYQTVDATLKQGDELIVKTKRFRVSQKPKATDDGTTYTIALLEYIKP